MHSMRVFKKGLGIFLALVIAVTAVYPALQQVMAAEYILDPSKLRGWDYTDSDRLAALLDQVFGGDIDIYSDSRYACEVSMPVGTYMDNDLLYYVKSQTTGNPVSGWQCYIYANAVYNKLFREWVGHANGFAHSRTVIPGGSDTLSYELMRDSGVRCGAYLRTTGNSDGSYSRSVGHSMIILAYDSQAITYLEGNGDGNGLVRVAIRTWSDFNKRQLSGRGRYISHMVQPTEAFYQAQFPGCSHKGYEGCGVCCDCGAVYDWQGTLDPWAQGIYRVTEQVIPRADAPYNAAIPADMTLEKDMKIRTTGQYRNAFEQIWYRSEDAEGNTFYVNGTVLKFVEYPELEVTCTDFSPAEGAQLEQKSYPVKGTVASNFPLRSISGYLDGELYATWTAEDETTVKVDLRQTDINQKLTFSKLSGGKHTVTLVVRSFVHGQAVTVHESSFYTVSAEPCAHDYIGAVTRDATCMEDGLLTYTCSKCDDAYTRLIVAHGHDYQNGACRYCTEPLPLSQLSGTVRSAGNAEIPVTITLTQDSEEIYSATAYSDSYLISDIVPGNYLLMAAKTDCAPLLMELNVEPGETVHDLKVCTFGDVNNDHKLNMGDISKLYAHIRGTSRLQDDYALLCADYNQDGNINVGDVVKLYSFLRKK